MTFSGQSFIYGEQYRRILFARDGIDLPMPEYGALIRFIASFLYGHAEKPLAFSASVRSALSLHLKRQINIPYL